MGWAVASVPEFLGVELVAGLDPYTQYLGTMAGAKVIPEGILLGIGNPLLDITIRGNSELLARYGLQENNAVLATQEHNQLFLEIADKYQPTYGAGGATLNSTRVAQWLLQTPGATTFIGSIGNDKCGHILEDIARKVGVNVVYQVCPGQVTGKCASIITGHNRSLVTEPGASRNLSLDFVRRPEIWAHVEKAKFFYEGGFLMSFSPEVVLAVAEHSSASKKTLVMNLHAPFLCKYFADPNLHLMDHVDVLFGNGDEATQLAQDAGLSCRDIKEVALKISQMPKANLDRPRLVVITQGQDPTLVAVQGAVQEIPVEPVPSASIVDTNGCGDAFVGGFLAQLVQGRPLADCLRCGFYAAREVIQHYGCQYSEKPNFV